jgi:hypothetical protein
MGMSMKKVKSVNRTFFTIRHLFFFLFFLILVQAVNAQPETREGKKGFDWSRFFLGGNLGNIRFGDITSIEISPSVGYRITKSFSAGIGGTYQFYNDRIYHFKTDIWGYRVFLSHTIYKNFFAYTEFEALSLESRVFDITGLYANQERFWLNSYFIGAGYRTEITKRSSAFIVVLYNLNETANSPYRNPEIRFGINF